MFTEKGLIKGLRRLSAEKSSANYHEGQCYCQKNASLHQKNTIYDSARKNNLAETYFGTIKNKDFQLQQHTKPLEEAQLNKTVKNVNDNLVQLHDLGDRNWSSADFPFQKQLSSISAYPKSASHHQHSSKHMTPSQRAYGCRAETAYGNYRSKESIKTIPNTDSGLVRIFSPEKSCYIERPATVENQSQRLAYLSMKSAANSSSVKICGGRAQSTSGKQFEKVVNEIKTAKPYTVSAETISKSWMDSGRPQTTSNYETARFNLINHTPGKPTSISRLLSSNKRACYKVKSIGEYSDITRVNAIRHNQLYQENLQKTPNCFSKGSQICAKQCDFAKTYGPFFKMY